MADSVGLQEPISPSTQFVDVRHAWVDVSCHDPWHELRYLSSKTCGTLGVLLLRGWVTELDNICSIGLLDRSDLVLDAEPPIDDFRIPHCIATASTMATIRDDSAQHIRKRQYQPSITSFFHRNGDFTRSTARVTSPLSPPLPADTQASLISVGMRVRKSVPEGYKTHKTLGTVGFPFPSSAPVVRISTPVSEDDAPVISRELTPFCGLHKVGGWAEQPSSSAPARFHIDAEDLMPELSRSQSTLYSTQGSFMAAEFAGVELEGSKKRGYEEDVEEDMDAIFDELEHDEDVEIQTRVIAQPRSLLKRSTAAGIPGQHLGQGDFEEASFLNPAEETAYLQGVWVLRFIDDGGYPEVYDAVLEQA
nr:hypothetical protein CFP56_67334 [Quercus suber]